MLNEFNKQETFENVSLKTRRVKLKRSVAILNYVLVQLQLAVTEGSVTESKHQSRNESHIIIHDGELIVIAIRKKKQNRRGAKKSMYTHQMSWIAPD